MSHLKILLNISRAFYELENFDKAEEYYNRVVEVDASVAEGFNYLSRSQDTSRSGNQGATQTVLFLDEN